MPQLNGEERVGYMRQLVFIGWLRRFHADIIAWSPQRKILLLVDNVPGHMDVSDSDFTVQIPNIEIVTLPRDLAAVTQPLDAGVIAVFNNYYHDFLEPSTMVHLERLKNNTKGSHYIQNRIAWKHVVLAWN
ncbi:hypothetical protein BGZ51_004823 [Haplosporangium sp. Z 767]|nr:hypothetical protein BGZ51_004823 [Haplosporangium sp. Z 767]